MILRNVVFLHVLVHAEDDLPQFVGVGDGVEPVFVLGCGLVLLEIQLHLNCLPVMFAHFDLSCDDADGVEDVRLGHWWTAVVLVVSKCGKVERTATNAHSLVCTACDSLQQANLLVQIEERLSGSIVECSHGVIDDPLEGLARHVFDLQSAIFGQSFQISVQLLQLVRDHRVAPANFFSKMRSRTRKPCLYFFCATSSLAGSSRNLVLLSQCTAWSVQSDGQQYDVLCQAPFHSMAMGMFEHKNTGVLDVMWNDALHGLKKWAKKVQQGVLEEHPGHGGNFGENVDRIFFPNSSRCGLGCLKCITDARFTSPQDCALPWMCNTRL